MAGSGGEKEVSFGRRCPPGSLTCPSHPQAAILQQTAEYIFSLEQEKTRLLQQNTQLKRFIQVAPRGGLLLPQCPAPSGCLSPRERVLAQPWPAGCIFPTHLFRHLPPCLGFGLPIRDVGWGGLWKEPGDFWKAGPLCLLFWASAICWVGTMGP